MEETIQSKKSFLKLAFPLIMQALVTAVISATDSILLGVSNPDALSAITLAGQVTQIYSGLIMALCGGATALSAQYYGNDDLPSVKKVMYITLQISLSASLLFAAVTLLLPETIMRIYTNDAYLITLGIPYLRIIAPTFLLMGFSQVIMNIMKNTGGEKRSSLAGASAAVLNILLDALLIFGLFGLPKLGVAGAALATLISRVFEFFLTLLFSRKQSASRFRFSGLFHSYKAMMQKYMRYTLPTILQISSWFVSSSLAVAILGHQGADVTAAAAAALIVFNIAGAIADGYASAVGITVGHLLGRNQLDKAKVTADRLRKDSLLLAAFIGLLICLCSPLIRAAGSNMTPQAQKYFNFMVFFVAFKLLGKFHNCSLSCGILSAGGDIRFVMKLDIIEMWCIVLPLGLLSAYVFRLPPLVTYVVLNLEEMYKITFMIGRYKKYRWLKNLTKKEWAEGGRYQNEIRRRLFEELPTGVMVIGNSGRISMINEACARLLGMTVEEAEGSNCRELFLQSGENQELADTVIEAVMDKDSTHEKTVTCRIGGEDFPVKICTGFMEDEDSKMGVFLTIQRL